jgi:hypothetical protein
MGYSARAIVGLGVEIDVQELTNAIVKHNEQLEETLDEDLYFDVDEHPDYKDPDSIYEFFDDEKINIELKNRNLYYDCTSYDYENLIPIFLILFKNNPQQPEYQNHQ